MAAKEREHARLGLPIHVNRADVSITLVDDDGTPKEISGRALLTDFKPKGIYLYSTERLPPNLEVIFEIHHPDHFRIVAKIIWCQYQPSSSRVLTEQSFHYRVGMGFHFENEEESNKFTEFCTRIQEHYVSPRVLFDKSPDIMEKAKTEAPANTPVSLAAVPLAPVPSAPTAPMTEVSAADLAEMMSQTPASEDSPTPAPDNVTPIKSAA
jgi:hypothetical protein